MSEQPIDTQRMREVYPMGRKPCAWCATRNGAHNFDCPVPDVNALIDALERASSLAPVAPDPSIDCPLCGVEVRQVASATLSIALWQHTNWACEVVKAHSLAARDRVAPPSGAQNDDEKRYAPANDLPHQGGQDLRVSGGKGSER